jgi:hypothetical protein
MVNGDRKDWDLRLAKLKINILVLIKGDSQIEILG